MGLTAACATERQPTTRTKGGDNAAAAQAAMDAARANAQLMANSRDGAERQCAALDGRPVSWEEERTMGTFFATDLAKKGGGLYLDAVPERDPTAMQARLAKSAGAPLPAGPKNDLVAYVQQVGAQVAKRSSRAEIAWTFAVLDDSKPMTSSTIGGYVFVTSGLIGKLQNEAELAAALAIEVAAVSRKIRLADYTRARGQVCRTGLTGLSLMQGGAADIPGADQFIGNSKFAKTLAALDGRPFANDPDVDHAFLAWLTLRVLENQQLTGGATTDLKAIDDEALALLAAAGYDVKALATVVELIGARGSTERLAAIELTRSHEAPAKKPGKSPAFPPNLKLPQ